MGLDMYLKRVPRYDGVTIRNLEAMDNYFAWEQAKKRGMKLALGCPSLQKWCGRAESDLPSPDAVSFYAKYYTPTYGEWDFQKRYPFYSIFEEVAYWRKVNQIHNWFVQNVQGGIDDCGSYEVSKEQLEELFDVCHKVLVSTAMIPGKIVNGYQWDAKTEKTVPIVEDGYVVSDMSVAETLLPSTDGFFFGGTEYDEYYMEGIQYTYDALSHILRETDFGKQMIVYRASW